MIRLLFAESILIASAAAIEIRPGERAPEAIAVTPVRLSVPLLPILNADESKPVASIRVFTAVAVDKVASVLLP